MSKFKFLINSSSLMVANILQPIFNFAVAITVSRKWGDEGLGVYTIVFALLMAFQLFCAFGLRNLLAREIAHDKSLSTKYLVNSGLVVLVFSTITFFIMILTVNILDYNPLVTKSAMILSVSLFATAIVEITAGIFTGQEKINIIASITIFEEFFKVAISIILLFMGHGLLSIVTVYVIMRYVNATLSLIFMRKSIGSISKAFDFTFIKEMIWQLKYFGASIVVVSYYWQMDNILLSKLSTFEGLGQFSSAFRVFRVIFLAFNSFIITLYPVLSQLYKSDEIKLQAYFLKAGKYLLAATLLVVLVTLFLSEFALTLFFGTEFQSAAVVLNVLIIGLPAFVISSLCAYQLLATMAQKMDFTVNFIAFIGKVIFLVIGIHYFDIVGAAVASVLSMYIYIIVQLPYIHNKIASIFSLKSLVVFGKITLSFGVALLIISLIDTWLFIKVGLGILSYGILLMVTNVVNIASFKEFLRKS